MTEHEGTTELNLSSILDLDAAGHLIGVEIINLRYQAEQAGLKIANVRIVSKGAERIKFDPDSDCLYVKIADGHSERQNKSDVTGRITASDLTGLKVGEVWQIGT